jgi:two-component system, cell cycle response regulator DivK
MLCNINMKNKTALIVEDNVVNRILVREILLEIGMKALEANNAETGIAMARELLPDIIIMDFKLPGMNGSDATELLKKDENTKHIPVIILTASAFEKDKKRAMNAGCEAFLTKPLQINELIQTMEMQFGIPTGENTFPVKKTILF